MLDRIDIQIDVPPVTPAELAGAPPAEGTAEVARRVAEAWRVQIERAAEMDIPDDMALNARMDGRRLERIAMPDEGGRQLLTLAAESGRITARGWVRALRLARTIADLEGSQSVRRRHVAEAVVYRRFAGGSETAAAP